MEKNKITVNKLLILNILWAIISIMIFIILDKSAENVTLNFQKIMLLIGWGSNLFYIWSIYSMYKFSKNILNHNIIFLTFIFLFCNGQTFLYTLGVDIDKLLVFNISNKYQLFTAACYFHFSLIFYQIGVFITVKTKKEPPTKEPDKTFNKSIKIFAIIMILAAIYPYISLTLPKLKASILYGYESLYLYENTYSGMFGYLSRMFVPGLLLLLYSFKQQKNNFKITFLFLIMIVIINLIIGARGDAISLFVILIIFYNNYQKKFEGKQIIKLLIITLIIMILIPVISSFRSTENKNIAELFNTIKDNIVDDENNFFVKTISELGYTMHSFILTEDVVPERVSYKYGESYISSILMLIPSQLLGGYSFAEKAALDTWLQNIHKMPYGPGYSIVAETYYNFGYIGGILFTIVLGYFFSTFFNLTSKDNNKNELLKILSLIFLYNSMIVARFPFHSTPRNLLYMYLLPYFMINVINNNLKRRNFNENYDIHANLQ